MESDPKQQTLDLLQRYVEATSDDRRQHYRNRIIQLNLGLAKKTAQRYASQCNEPFEDLLQEGVLGMSRAIARFDPCRNLAFSSFAMPYIRGGIQHYLRDRGDTIRLPRAWSDKRSKIERLKREGHPLEAIATELRFKSVGELTECEAALRRLPLKSIDTTEADRAIALEWDGSAIELVSIEGILMDSGFDVMPDGFFDATTICKQEGKLFAEFRRLESTRRRVTELQNMGQTHIYKISRGKNGKSFLHKSMAFEFLMWVNPTRYRSVLLGAMVGNLESMYGSGSRVV